MSSAEQLASVSRLHHLLERHGVEYWLFGGWAVDFYAQSVTRAHDDLDIAVWLSDHPRIASLLAADGWSHVPDEQADGYTKYERGAVQLEVAFLARDPRGPVYTPLRNGRAAWPREAFGDERAELLGVSVRIISLQALKAEKSEARDDVLVAAKDRADRATLCRIS